MQFPCLILNSTLDRPSRVAHHLGQLLLVSLIYDTLVGNSGVIVNKRHVYCGK